MQHLVIHYVSLANLENVGLVSLLNILSFKRAFFPCLLHFVLDVGNQNSVQRNLKRVSQTERRDLKIYTLIFYMALVPKATRCGYRQEPFQVSFSLLHFGQLRERSEVIFSNVKAIKYTLQICT